MLIKKNVTNNYNKSILIKKNLAATNIISNKIYILSLKHLKIALKNNFKIYFKYKNIRLLLAYTLKIIQSMFNKTKLLNTLAQTKTYYINNYKRVKTKYVVRINIYSSNIFIHISDITGNSLYRCSSGTLKFKGSEKTKNLALKSMIKKLTFKIKVLKINHFNIHFKGIKKNRKKFIKSLKNNFTLGSIKFYNFWPHNGCRPKKIARK